MFNRLKTTLDSQCRIITDLSKENQYVYTLTMKSFVWNSWMNIIYRDIYYYLNIMKVNHKLKWI